MDGEETIEIILDQINKAMLRLTDHIDRLMAAQAATDERLKRLVEAQAAVHRPQSY